MPRVSSPPESALARRLGWDGNLSEMQCLSLVNQVAEIRRTEVSLRSNSLRGGRSLRSNLQCRQPEAVADAAATRRRADVAAGEWVQSACSTADRVGHDVCFQTSSGQKHKKSQEKLAASPFVAETF